MLGGGFVTLCSLPWRVKDSDMQLVGDIERDVEVLEKRRAFGLNFG